MNIKQGIHQIHRYRKYVEFAFSTLFYSTITIKETNNFFVLCFKYERVSKIIVMKSNKKKQLLSNILFEVLKLIFAIIPNGYLYGMQIF